MDLVQKTTVKFFWTSGSGEVGEAVAKELEGIFKSHSGESVYEFERGKHSVTYFSNENPEVQITENARGCRAVVLHTQTSPVAQGTLEFIALLQAMQDAHVKNPLVVFPYMPYSRSDRKNKSRISTMGKAFLSILKIFGIEDVLLCDPHDAHLKHYLTPTADEISAKYLFTEYIKDFILREKLGKKDCVIVYADAGSFKRYDTIAHILHLPSVVIDKDRPDNSEDPDIKRLSGDVDGKICFIIDDEILTGGTSIKDSEMLKRKGAKKVFVCAIHPIFMDKNLGDEMFAARLEESCIDRFIVGNTVPIRKKIQKMTKIEMVFMERFIAEAIYRLIVGKSLTELHNPDAVEIYRV